MEIDQKMWTPNYKYSAPPYKSKLWGSNRENPAVEPAKSPNLSDNAIQKYLQKSSELSKRASIQEKNMKRFSNNIIGDRKEEEIGDMLIDSILYKVNVLQNI